MFGSDIVVAKLEGFFYCATKRCFRSRGEGKFALSRIRPSLDQSQDLCLGRGFRDARFAKHLRRNAVGGFEQCEKQMLRSHEPMPQTAGLYFRFPKDNPCTISESFENRYIECEPLVGRLLADTERTADLGPRVSTSTALVNEMPEKCVPGLFEFGDGLRGA